MKQLRVIGTRTRKRVSHFSGFHKCAVSPRAAKQMTQGKIALSRLQHQLHPRIARPARRGSPFSANVKKLTRCVSLLSALFLFFSFASFASPACERLAMIPPFGDRHFECTKCIISTASIYLSFARNRTGCVQSSR